MPYFVLHALDRPDAAADRARLRAAHRAYIRRPHPDGRCVLGGPLEDETGAMVGSMLVVETSDQDAAARFFAGDPYASAGLYAERRLHPWRWGLGRTPGDDLPPPHDTP